MVKKKIKEKINKEFLIGLLAGIIIGIVVAYCVFYFAIMQTIDGTIRTFESLEGIVTNANFSMTLDFNETALMDQSIKMWEMKVA